MALLSDRTINQCFFKVVIQDKDNDQYDKNADDEACYDSDAYTNDKIGNNNPSEDGNNTYDDNYDAYDDGDNKTIEQCKSVNDYDADNDNAYNYHDIVFGKDRDHDKAVATLYNDLVINRNHELVSPHVPDYQSGREPMTKNDVAIDHLPPVFFGKADFNEAFQDAYHHPNPIQKDKWHAAMEKEFQVMMSGNLFANKEDCMEHEIGMKINLFNCAILDFKKKGELEKVLLSNTHNRKDVGGCCSYCCVDSGTKATGIAQSTIIESNLSPGCESTII